ncbi:FAD-dependent monooxygenase [Winogradskya consettensis]|uniref:FAD-dependent monooxygenase n=1 Tax=Winogradskya consettensis TaxID=113560 RepID=UPI001BB37FC7|nr:FAD-dependent monooxygenase [Actinoplanes consettensis]
MRRSVLIVGGGIAGLTHAIAARRAGFDVEVVEVRPDWAVAGWGLSLTGPALRALRSVDLEDVCLAAGYPISRTLNCDVTGTVHNVMELPSVLGPGRPAEAGMGRPVLHEILRARAAELGATLRTGLSVRAAETNGDQISVRLDDGTTRTTDYLLGADGVRSRTREQLGLTGEPRYTGQMVWRALVDRPEWATDIHTFGGPTFTAGLIPISADKGYVFLTEGLDDPEPLAGDLLADRMRELLAPFSGRLAEVRDTITEPGQVVRRPVHALFVDGPWHAGRGVLAGDAAHSPSPQLVSGAALAIEDAVVLAEEMAVADDVEKALAAYGTRRHDRARALVETSVALGRAEREGRRDEMHALQRQGHGGMAAPI